MKKLYFLIFIFSISIASFGQVVINEFQPNPAGADPANPNFEIKGAPSTTFSGFVLFIESDPGTSNPGDINNFFSISGTFDSNGLLNVVLSSDPENPSFTVALVDSFTGDTSTDLDADDDGVADDLSTIGTVYDAIGIPDTTGEPLYGAQLGGADFAFTGSEPQLVFRDGSSGDWYAINATFGNQVFDINATDVFPTGSFDNPPDVTTFGSVNPVYTVSTGPVILAGTVSTSLNYEFGSGPSGEGTFTVEGTNLTDDILVSAPADFEISETSGGTFTPSITLTEGGTGAVAETTIYVRLKESLAINSYAGDVTLTSTGADSKTVALTGNVYAPPTNNLVLTGAYDGPLSGGTPKGIELYAKADIPDLSKFGVSSVSNGGGSSAGNIEYTFPADAVSAGTYIWLATESTQFTAFFGFAPTYTNGVVSINGDDSIELYENGVIIDTFGTVDCDPNAGGSPCPEWDHLDGWGYRLSNTGPDGTFVLANWGFSGPNAFDGETSNATAATPFPAGTYPGFLSVNKIDSNIFTLYPNPTNTGFVNITSSNSEVIKANVFDVLGKNVLEGKVENNQLNVSNLNAGMYILRLSQNNATVTKKLVIQ